MDKIFMKIVMVNGSIDVLFNAYKRHHAFVLNNKDILEYVEYFDKVLEEIENLICEYSDEMKVQNA